MNIKELIKLRASELGFLDCRIIPVSPLNEEIKRLKTWLADGMHGEMAYMARNIEKRLDPRHLVENAESVIVVLQSYYPKKSQLDPEAPVISKYAYGTDYHPVIRSKLKILLEVVRNEIASCNGRVFTDSAPVLERAWARRAGLGWIGKNSNLITVEHGSFFFIGEIILDIELPYDEVMDIHDRCGTCTRCMDACPTGAIISPRIVDARRCISYQTIELKGELDQHLKGKFMNRVFGCDICQDVCPWNLKSVPHQESAFEPAPELLGLEKKDWFALDRVKFNNLFRYSAVKRSGYEGLKRNLDFINPESHGETT